MRTRLLLSMLLLLPALAAVAKPRHDLREVDAAFEAFHAASGLDGASLRLATEAEGEVYRRHLGDQDDGTRMPIASASKWLSALVLARLVEQGVLRWDSTVGEWFPEAPPATHGITLAQLYSHTSGIASGEDACLSDRDTTLQACALSILAQPLAWAPGTTFAYGGNSMQVGGAMAERASGRRWDLLFQQEVVMPLGLRDTDWSAFTGLPGYVPNPNARVAGGARSTLSDYAIVVDMVLAGGRHAGRDYLQPATIAAMAVDRTRGLVVADTPVPGLGYGFGQWVEATDAAGVSTRVSSPGAFGFTPWVDWTTGSNGVVAVLGSGPALREPLFALEGACLRALGLQRSLLRPTPPAPAPRAALDAREPAH